MSVSPEIVLYAIGGLGTGLGTFVAGRHTSRRDRETTQQRAIIEEGKLELEDRRADGEAYERAQQINQQIVEGLRQELTALQATIHSLRADLAAAQQHSAKLEDHIRNLEASADTMRQLLRDAGISYVPSTTTREA